MTQVHAIVVTHDAPDARDRRLGAIDAQTRAPDRVLIVDNASREPALAGTRRVPVEILRLDENTGPAGGHALGLATFLESSANLAG